MMTIEEGVQIALIACVACPLAGLVVLRLVAPLVRRLDALERKKAGEP